MVDSEFHETPLPGSQEHRSIMIQAEPLVTLLSHVSSSSTPQRSYSPHSMYTPQTGLTCYVLSLQQTSEAVQTSLTSSIPLNTTTTHMSKELQTPSIIAMATSAY